MRQNFFGEKIAQPGDDYSAVDMAFLNRFGEPMNLTSANIFTEEDEQFKFGEEAMDDDCNTITFDGFESVQAAKDFAINVLQIDETAVEVCE